MRLNKLIDKELRGVYPCCASFYLGGDACIPICSLVPVFKRRHPHGQSGLFGDFLQPGGVAVVEQTQTSGYFSLRYHADSHRNRPVSDHASNCYRYHHCFPVPNPKAMTSSSFNKFRALALSLAPGPM